MKQKLKELRKPGPVVGSEPEKRRDMRTVGYYKVLRNAQWNIKFSPDIFGFD